MPALLRAAPLGDASGREPAAGGPHDLLERPREIAHRDREHVDQAGERDHQEDHPGAGQVELHERREMRHVRDVRAKREDAPQVGRRRPGRPRGPPPVGQRHPEPDRHLGQEQAHHHHVEHRGDRLEPAGGQPAAEEQHQAHGGERRGTDADRFDRVEEPLVRGQLGPQAGGQERHQVTREQDQDPQVERHRSPQELPALQELRRQRRVGEAAPAVADDRARDQDHQRDVGETDEEEEVEQADVGHRAPPSGSPPPARPGPAPGALRRRLQSGAASSAASTPSTPRRRRTASTRCR